MMGSILGQNSIISKDVKKWTYVRCAISIVLTEGMAWLKQVQHIIMQSKDFQTSVVQTNF